MDAKSLAHLEELGLEAVSAALAKGDGSLATVGGEFHSQVELWVRAKEKEVSATAASARSEARSEESLSISRKALRNSDRATWIATSAIVLSIIMAIQKIIEWLPS